MRGLSSLTKVPGPHDMVAFGGYEFQRRPVALARRVARGEMDPDVLIAAFGGLEIDIAIRNPSVRELRYGALTLGVYGLAPTVTARARTTDLASHEYGATSILRCLQAGARLLPHIPSYAALPARANDDGRVIGELSALNPDAALLHVPYADPESGYAWGYGLGTDLIVAAACREVLVSYDIAVTSPPSMAGAFVVPPNMITGLAHQPLGAFPSGSYPLYPPYAPFYEYYFDLEPHSARATELIVNADDRSFLRRFFESEDLDLFLAQESGIAAEVRQQRKALAEWIQT